MSVPVASTVFGTEKGTNYLQGKSHWASSHSGSHYPEVAVSLPARAWGILSLQPACGEKAATGDSEASS